MANKSSDLFSEGKDTIDALFTSAFNSLTTCRSKLELMGRGRAVVKAPTFVSVEKSQGAGFPEGGDSEVRVQDGCNQITSEKQHSRGIPNNPIPNGRDNKMSMRQPNNDQLPLQAVKGCIVMSMGTARYNSTLINPFFFERKMHLLWDPNPGPSPSEPCVLTTNERKQLLKLEQRA